MRVAKLTLLLTALLAAQNPPAKSLTPTTGGRRLALAIGNVAYPSMPLKNPANDARSLAAMLTELGFTVDLALDTTRPALEAAIDRFITKLKPGDVGLFYYSGHGIQVDGENFLIPVDFAAQEEAQVKYQAYSAALLHERMQSSRARLNILILDACRDNPFRVTRSGAKGWATMGTGSGSMVAFATAPGATASDNPAEANGLFTKYLLETLRRPGLRLDDVFNQVREGVYTASKAKQLPWAVTSVIGSFIFRDPDAEEAKVREEVARLEKQLKDIERQKAEADKQRSEQISQDKAREAEAVRARLEFERKEEESLKKESAERQSALADHNAAADREERRKAEEARLAELRRKAQEAQADLAKQNDSGMTLEQAQAAVASLQLQIDTIEIDVKSARAKALAQLDSDYNPRKEVLERASGKDAFETTGQFQARLTKIKADRTEFEQKYAAERAKVENRYVSIADEQEKPLRTRIADLTGRTYPLTTKAVEWKSYDADSTRLQVIMSGIEYSFAPVAPGIARDLHSQYSQMRFEGNLRDGIVLLILPTRERVVGHGPRLNAIDGLIYVWIPPGTFQMGCSPGDNECYKDEKPPKQVRIPKGFWLGESEVTQAAYQKVVGANPSRFPGADRPVEQVNWTDASAYCRAIGGRLPTEAEWEYAARAGSTEARYGDADHIAWHGFNSDFSTHPVKQKVPNAWRLYDMLGNVWEWTDSNGSKSTKVLRGLSWNDNSRAIRVSDRYTMSNPNFTKPGTTNNIGFRCVWD